MIKTLNYCYGGESHAITLRPYVPYYSDKCLVVRSDGQNWYAPLIDTSSSLLMPSDIKVNFGGTTYRVGTNPDLIMNRTNERAAQSCTLIADNFDFGIDGGDGAEYYSNMTHIRATQPNSSIIGSANANTVTLAGGSENFLAGGLGKDTYILHDEDALIVDFGVGIVQFADGTSLATSVTDEIYNRFDTGTYACGNDQLNIYGVVTGIYCDRPTVAATKIYGVVDVAVVYDGHVVLLKNIVKNCAKTSSSASGRVWKDNSYHLKTFKLFAAADGSNFNQITFNNSPDMFHEWDDFPVELRPKLIRLYQMYDESDFTCSAVDMEVNHQVLPDWLGGDSD